MLMKTAISNFIGEIKFSVIGENTSFNKKYSTEGFSLFNIANELSATFLYLQTTKSLKSNSKKFKLYVKGLNKNEDIVNIESKNSLAINDTPSDVYSFFAIAIQEMLFNPMTNLFFVNLLIDENDFYNNNNLYLPHASNWIEFNPLMEVFLPTDTFQKELIINSIDSAQNTIQRYEQNKDILEVKLKELLLKTNSLDILYLIFGNYNKINNIHSCTRLYVLAKTILNLKPNKKTKLF